MALENKAPRVLFITRKYPPQVGGMENYSYGLISNYSGHKRVIALRRGQIHLLWFIPYAFLLGLWYARNCKLIYLTDGLLAPLGVVLRRLSRRPVFVTVHGLDITFENWLYRKVAVSSLKRLDAIVTVSRKTIEECVKRGIDIEKCTFIPNGFSRSKVVDRDLTGPLHIPGILIDDLSSKKVLLTVGRLIRRKGVYWFVDTVFPHLPKTTIYLIVGRGEEYERIQSLIQRRHLHERVFLLGYVPENDLREIYSRTDVFVMPNIKVTGDIEGFGIVALEAAASGIPVVAAKLEGIQEAIIHKKNGFLVPSGDAQAFAETITQLLAQPSSFRELMRNSREYTTAHFSWSVVIGQYEKLFQIFLQSTPTTIPSVAP